MPLIIMTGVPASGKTTRAKELKAFFESHNKEVHIISEYEHIVKAGFEKNSFYADSNKEKQIRGLLMSEVLKSITADNVVILDASNYIKGYRYEIYCATKSNKCTQCTVQTEINREQAWSFNENRHNDAEKYDRVTFDALVMRYEDPHGNNRWDKPLFVVFPEMELKKEEIFMNLFKKKPPKPNMSTQNPPVSATNFLYDLDQITMKIVDEISNAVDKGESTVKLLNNDQLEIDLSNLKDKNKLLSLRRQYITYSKMNTPEPDQVPMLFVQYLKTSIS